MKLTKPRKHILGMTIALVLSAPLSAANNEVIINQNSTAVAEGNLAEVHQSGDINLAAVDQALNLGDDLDAAAEDAGLSESGVRLVDRLVSKLGPDKVRRPAATPVVGRQTAGW